MQDNNRQLAMCVVFLLVHKDTPATTSPLLYQTHIPATSTSHNCIQNLITK